MDLKKKLGQLYTKAYGLHQEFFDQILTRFSSRQIKDLPEMVNPFFVTGISGSLHIMNLALKYIPSNVDLVLILNGMEKWEQDWAKNHFEVKAVITMDSKRTLPHSAILDLLLDNYANPFGILDYDCFVFNQECFTAIQSFTANSVINSLFEYKYTNVNLRIPHTFFLFFNSQVIKRIKDKYGVNSSITDFRSGLNSTVLEGLNKIGINENNYPETNKKYFDTLRLLVCLAYSEGYSCNILDEFVTKPVENSDAFHVGGVANPNYYKSFWSMRGVYFWRRALEECKDLKIKQKYHEKYGFKRPEEVFEKSPEIKNQISQEFYNFIEGIVH